jgi:hypothetical protein
MRRLILVAILILLFAGLAGGALITRYRYFDVQGIPLFRVDRWTGIRERWTCSSETSAPSGTGHYVSIFKDPYNEKAVSGWDANQ